MIFFLFHIEIEGKGGWIIGGGGGGGQRVCWPPSQIIGGGACPPSLPPPPLPTPMWSVPNLGMADREFELWFGSNMVRQTWSLD